MLPKVHLIGNLAKDPIVCYTRNNTKYVQIVIACSKIPTKNQTNSAVNYFYMNVWNLIADFVKKYLKKGDGVYILGNLENHSYLNKQLKTVYVTDIIVQNLQLTNKRSQTTTLIEQVATNGIANQEQNNNLIFQENTYSESEINEFLKGLKS